MQDVNLLSGSGKAFTAPPGTVAAPEKLQKEG